MSRSATVVLVLLSVAVVRAFGQECRTLSGHNHVITAVVFSPDGRTLASASWDETIRLWDLTTGRSTATLSGHSDWVLTATISPDGRTLTSASQRTLRRWDLATGDLTATLPGLSGPKISSMRLAGDGRLLACGLRDGRLQVWDVRGEKLPDRPKLDVAAHKSWPAALAVSPDLTLVATGSHTGEITLWHVATGQPKPLAGHQGFNVAALAFAADGQTLASGSFDTTVKLWDVSHGKEVATLKGHKGLVLSLAFSPDGGLLASGERNGPIKLWDLAAKALRATLPGHSDKQLGFSVTAIAFAPDGKTLASGSYDKTVKLWTVQDK